MRNPLHLYPNLSASGPPRPFAKVLRLLQGTLLGMTLGVAAASAHAGQAPSRLYVISNGWHTEIALPAAALTGPLGVVRVAFPEARYFAFGWGERAFYMSPHPTWTEALRALLPARAVLLVLGLGMAPPHAFEAGIHVAALPVSPSGLSAVAGFVWRSFATSRSGSLQRLGPGPDPASAFYAASGTYDGTHTCNTWTAGALQTAGLPVSSHGVVFAGQVMRQIRALGTDPAPSGALR
ncbi:MAG: DUF2459 domain-containing protein [Acetobacteraceae bacterium]